MLLEMLEEEQFIVIDDDESTLFYSSAVIKRFFYYKQVLSFKDPSKAVDYFRKVFSHDPAKTLVLLDLNMPELSGWEVLDELQMLPVILKEKLTIIVVSSFIDAEAKIKTRDNPLVIGYIEKPLSIKKLKVVMDLKKAE